MTNSSRPTAASWRCSASTQCEGWLEGYLLTGRHGLFNSYEAFIHIIDSMFNQHAKWLKSRTGTALAPERSPRSTICSPPTSGGRITTASRTRTPASSTSSPTRAECRAHLSAARRQLPVVGRRSLPAQPPNYVNVIVGDKQAHLQYLTMDAAIMHCTQGHRHLGLGQQRPGRSRTWSWPAAGDIPTHGGAGGDRDPARTLPDLKIRFVNVVDLFKLQPSTEHPHGLSDRDFDSLFHHRQAHHLQLPRLSVADPPAGLPPGQPDNMHVRGYKEKGSINTPLELAIENNSTASPSPSTRSIACRGCRSAARMSRIG